MQNWEFNFTAQFIKERVLLKKNDQAAKKKLDKILLSIKMNPRSGIGKPERLKHKQIETWSRRIDKKNRIQYRIIENIIIVISCLGHYDD